MVIANGKYTVSLYDQQGALKSTYEVLNDIAPIWEKLNEQEKTNLGYALASKTQYEVFAATMTNFGTAVDATSTALNSSGSAINENSKFMEGLEASVNNLKAAWETLVNKTINSDFIKSLIDAGTALIKFASSDIGQTIIKTALLTGTLVGLGKILQILGTTRLGMAIKMFGIMATSEIGLAGATKVLTATIGQLTLAMLANPLFIGGVIIASVVAVNKVIDLLTVSFEEQIEVVSNLKSELQSLQSEIDSLVQKDNRTENEEEYLKVLKAEKIVLEDNLITAAKLAHQKYTQKQTLTPGMSSTLQVAKGDFGGGELAYARIKDYTEQINKLDSSSNNYAETLDKLKGKRAEEIDKMRVERDLLQDILDVGGKLTPEQQAQLDKYNALIVALGNIVNATNGATDSTGELGDVSGETAEEVGTLKDALDGLSSSLSVVGDAFKEFANDGELSYSTLSDIYDSFGELDNIDSYIAKLGDANLTSQDLQDIMGEMAIALAEEKIATLGASEATEVLIIKLLKQAGVANAAEIANRLLSSSQVGLKFSGAEAAEGLTQEERAAILTRIALLGVKSASDSVSKSTLNPAGIIAGLNQIITKASEAQAALNMVSGGTGIVGALKGAIASGATQLGKTIIPKIQWTPDIVGGGGGTSGGGGEKDDTDEYLESLKDAITLLESQLTLLEKSNKSESERITKIKELQSALKTQADYMRSIGANQSEINALSAKWWDYEKEILDIQKEMVKIGKEIAETRKDAYETTFNYISNLIDKEIDALEEQRDTIEETYDAQIDALKETNNELEKQIKYEELLKNLAEAKSKKLLVYKDGKYQYVSDISAISEAQEALDAFNREKQFEQTVKNLENAKDAELKAIDEQIKGFEKYKEAWSSVVSNYKESQDKLIAEQILGISLENDNWQTRLSNLADFVAEYNSIMSQIESLKQAEEALGAPVGETDSPTLSGVDAIKQAMASNSELWHHTDDAGKRKLEAANQELGASIGATYNPASGTWAYANGTTSAHGGLSMVGEQGAEMRVLNRGDGIIPADITRNLMQMGKNSPNEWLNKVKTVSSNGQSMIINVDHLSFPNVVDGSQAKSIVTGLKNLAIQEVYKRA